MFPPFPEEKAATILEKVLSALKNGQLSLVQVARPSEERKNQGVMLGALVCKDKEGNEVNLVTNSGISKCIMHNARCRMKNAQCTMINSEEATSANVSDKRKTENGKRKDEDTVISEDSQNSRDSNFPLSTFHFQFVEPIVPAHEIEEALAENDGKIHELTEKIKAYKLQNAAAESEHTSPTDDSALSIMNYELKQLCSASLSKVHALYNFHCIDGKIRSLKEICDLYNKGKLPPTGTGDCCAPKLLDYAFSHDLIPISLAETEYTETSGNDCSTAEGVPLAVWSDSGSQTSTTTNVLAESVTAKPDRQNEQGRAKQCPVPNFPCSLLPAHSSLLTPPCSLLTPHSSLLPAHCSLLTPPCDERCGILLPAMLGLRILYRDEAICVVNKQSGLLSVPGRGEDKQDCVESRFRRLFGDAVEILQPAVHRLDMETSGIMILAFTKEAHRELNRQFEAKEVQKEYVALLDGILPKMGIPPHGQMELFFRLDVNNRPHQIWDAEKGKSAITEWEILGVERYHAPDGTTRNASRVLFKPHTGRTHQLRLASSDSHGFGCPIIGDTLYGHCEEGERLMLHAKKIEFTHPLTKERMTIECDPEF